MGITLTSKTINSTYDSLLKLSDNDQLTGAFKVITDGLGNDTGVSLNNTGDVTISGTLTVNTRINTPLIQLTGGTGTQGELSWNADEETLDLINNGAVLQLGQEIHIHVRNNSVTTAIPNGTPVYVAGTLGASGRLKVAPMIADGSVGPEYFIGVTTEEIEAGGDGKVTFLGKVRGFNTLAYAEGAKLYVSETVAGGWQTTEPTAPHPKLEVAFTVNSANNGTLFVRSQNGHYLTDTHDINITSVADKDLLVYDSALGIWKNSKTLGDISTGNITTSGYLRGPETFIIDPAAYGNNTGLVQILGDLRVDGVTTTVNSTTVTINDKNIVLADEASTAADANGAGITINGAGATLTYASATDDFHFNKNVNAGTFIGALTGNVTGNVTGNLTGNASTASKWATARTITLGGDLTGNVSIDGSANVTLTASVVNDSHTHDGRYYTETELDGGQLDNRYYTETELDAGQLDNRYYTETESDAKYLLNTTDTFAGKLTVSHTTSEYVAQFTGGNDTNVIIGHSSGAASGEQYISYTNGTTAASGNAWMVGMDDDENFKFAYGTQGEINGSTNVKVTITQAGNTTFGGDVAINGELSVSGTIDLSNADLNIGAADIIFDMTSLQANRGLVWDISGTGFVSKFVGGGTNGGMVELYTNMDDAITTGDVFRVKEGSVASTLFSINGNGAATFSNSVTANSFIKSGGTSSQFLKADGSVDSNSYLTSYTESDTLQSVTNRGSSTTNAITSSSAAVFNLTNSGTGTYNKTVIYNDSSGFLLEGAKATDSNDAAKLPVTLTWRGNYNGNGGLKLNGDTKLYTNDSGLGIDFTNPTVPLAIQSNTSANAISIIGRSDNIGELNFMSSGNATLQGRVDGRSSGHGLGLWAWGNDIKFYMGGSETMAIRTDGKVEINSGQGSGSRFRVWNDMSIYNTVYFTNSSYVHQSAIGGNGGELYLYTNGTANRPMTLTSGGSVLIGRTSNATSQALQVEGFIDQTQTTAAVRLYNGSTFVGGIGNGQWGFSSTYLNDYVVYAQNDLLFTAGGGSTPKMVLNSLGNVGIGTTSPERRLVLDGINGTPALEIKKSSDRIVYLGTGSSAFGDDNTTMLLYHSNVIKINLNTVGDSYFNGGNVGIGTTNPSVKLHTYQTGTSDNILRIQNGENFYASVLQLTANNDGGAAYNSITSNTNGGSEHWRIWGAGSVNTLAIRTGGTERMRIDSSGNVGIGGTPTHKLYVRNDVAASTDLDPTSIKLYNNSDGGSAIEFSNAVGGNSKISLGVEGAGSSSDESYIGFSTGANAATASERMRIDSSGNVGINETNPQYALDVSGTVQVQGYLNTDDYIEKILGTAYFTHGTSNLAVDVRFGNNSFWGYIELEITSTYSNQNSAGRLTATYAIGTNPNGNIYTNVKRINNAQGTIVDNIAFGDFGWDSANSTFRIPISHITSNGNSYTVKVRMFTHSGGAENAYDDITVSGLYTLTALSKQYPYYGERLDIGDNTYSNQQYKLVLNNSTSETLSHIVYDTMLIQQNDAPALRLYESGESLSTTLASDNGVSRLASSGKLALHAGGSSTAVAYNGMGGSQAVMILTNGFVGINQGNPSYQLDVNGDSGIAARFQTTNDITLQLESTNNWNGIRWKDSAGQDDIWFYGGTQTWAFGGGGSTISGKKMHIHGGTSIGSGAGAVSTPTNGLYVEGGMQVGIGSYSGGQNTNQSIYIVSPAATEYFTMGYKQTARSGEVMHRNNNAGASSAFYIEAGAGEAGGICLDQDSVNVYGSSDLGTTFRVIDKDSDVVTFEMLQTSWNGVFRGDVIAYGSMSSISDKRIKENIEPYENVLDRLCTLGVYSYNKITAPKHKRDKKEIGVIAQEMQVAFPELVETEKVDKPEDANGLEEILTVDYEHLTAILLQSVKELREEVNQLKERLDGSTN